MAAGQNTLLGPDAKVAMRCIASQDSILQELLQWLQHTALLMTAEGLNKPKSRVARRTAPYWALVIPVADQAVTWTAACSCCPMRAAKDCDESVIWQAFPENNHELGRFHSAWHCPLQSCGVGPSTNKKVMCSHSPPQACGWHMSVKVLSSRFPRLP